MAKPFVPHLKGAKKHAEREISFITVRYGIRRFDYSAIRWIKGEQA
ncbi:Hypothetical protein ABZS17I87_00396 [Kosakonia cowanii]